MEGRVVDPLASRLGELERRVTGRLAAVLHRRGSSLEEWRVLTSLAAVRLAPMGEVAAHEGWSAPTLSRLVDRLVDAGLVHRETDAADRRRVLVGLADGGRRRYRELYRAVEEEQAALRAVVGHDDLARLERLLATALRRLREAEGPPPGP